MCYRMMGGIQVQHIGPIDIYIYVCMIGPTILNRSRRKHVVTYAHRLHAVTLLTRRQVETVEHGNLVLDVGFTPKYPAMVIYYKH